MIAEVFTSMFLVWLIWYFISTYMARKNMPPGPFPYPFVGNIPQIVLADPINPFSKLAEKHGDIFTVTFPTGNAVILNSAAVIREAREIGNLIAGKASVYPIDIMMGVNGVAGAHYSPAYVFRKKVLVSALHLFGSGVERASNLAKHAVNVAIEEIKTEPGKPFSVKKVCDCSVLVQIWEWLTSNKLPVDDPIIKQLREFAELFVKMAILNTVNQLFPLMGSLPTQFSRDIKRAEQIRETLCPPEYRAHEETYTPGVIRDLTDSFICAYDKEIAKETGKNIGTKDDIPTLIMNVAFTAFDTVSSSLAWFFLYMVVRPDIQKKIQEEIDDVVGRDRIPSWEDAPNMPYLQATLCEVQRECGVLALIGSDVLDDVSIAGYHIPKGTFVGMNFPKVHHDEQVWPEPNKFKPERFLDTNGQFIGWKVPGFIPFGLGQRECAGQGLAKVVMFSFASMLLHRYNIELPEGAKKPSTKVPNPHIVNEPEEFFVVAKERNTEKKIY